MIYEPFYNPEKTYEENFQEGPFGVFADKDHQGKLPDAGPAKYDFFGFKVNSPFGIPAGPLINSNFCHGAFAKGFDICVYKTVRSKVFPCHPYPNILSVKVKGDLKYDNAQNKLVADHNYEEPLSITNSFGVPSKEVKVWQKDVRKAISYAKEEQILIMSFMGTVRENQTREEFVADYVLAAKESLETGAKILETNLSCPNIGNEGLVCYDLDMTEKICQAIRQEIENTPLILKVGYYKDDEDIKRLAEITEKYAQGISAINTIPAEIVDKDGKQALSGPNRIKSGVCGASIKWAGLEMVMRLNEIRRELGYTYAIIGVGGVINPSDFFEYRKAGADIVMSATGAMWNPYLAQEIKSRLK